MAAQKRSSPAQQSVSDDQLQRILYAEAVKWLSEAGVRGEFDQLVAANCNANTLIALLVSLNPTADSWENLTGFERRKLSTVLKRMEQCAEDIERLNASSIAQLLLRSATDQSHSAVPLVALPTVLRSYADLLKGLARVSELQPRAKPHTDHARALLTAYVIESTHQPHDNPVARLLSVILNRPDLTADSQKDWRGEHRELLRTIAPSAANLTNHTAAVRRVPRAHRSRPT